MAAPALALAGSGLAHFELLSPFAGFKLFAVCLPLAVAAFIASTVALFRTGAAAENKLRARAWKGLGLSTVTLTVVLIASASGFETPVINDITTDFDDPPAFVRAATLDGNRGRDMSYPRVFAHSQKVAYSELGPLRLELPPHEAFEHVRQALGALEGLEVSVADRGLGSIEAQARSRVFHFVDDVVVRVRSEGRGVRIDLRSRSRDGKGDLGVNAARIESIIEALR